MKNFDFEYEFESDKDIENQFDDLVACIGSEINMAEQDPATINPIKLYQIQFAYAVMKYLTKNTGVKVKYELHKPFRSMGNVSVEGAEWTVTNSVWFFRAARFASNMEIYPLTNGRFRLVFTFHGLVKKIK